MTVLSSGLDRSTGEAAKAASEAQDREIALASGRDRGVIKSVVQSRTCSSLRRQPVQDFRGKDDVFRERRQR